MIALALGLLLLGAAVWGRRFWAGAGRALGVWRPAAGLTTVVLWTLTLVLGIRENWIAAIAVGAAAAALSLATRWRAAPRSSGRPSLASSMSMEEARSILGVSPSPSREEVNAAYRRLIRVAHPDGGGTRGLAAQLNGARDLLLRSLSSDGEAASPSR